MYLITRYQHLTRTRLILLCLFVYLNPAFSFSTWAQCELSAPQDFEVVEATENSVTIRWEDLGGSRYRIPFEQEGFGEKFFAWSETNEVTIDQLKPGTNYRMWAYTFCGDEKSERSGPFYFSTTGESACPVPVITSIDTLSETAVRVNWEAVDVLSYEVRLRKATQDGQSFDASFFTTEENSLELNGLEKDTKYWVWVRSLCDFKFVPGSQWTERNLFSLMINDCGGRDTAAFQLVEATDESLRIRFKAANRFFGGETSYSLNMQAVGMPVNENLTASDKRVSVHQAPEGWVEWTVGDLVIGQAYRFTARYICSTENTYISQSDTLTTTGACPPAVAPKATVTTGTATLDWQDADYAMERVSVRLRVRGSDTLKSITDVPVGEQSIHYSDLQPGTVYEYEIRQYCLDDVNYSTINGSFTTDGFQTMIGSYLTDLKLFPVPVVERLNVIAVSIKDVNCIVTIDYMSGKRLLRKEVALKQGFNRMDVDMALAKTGAYYLRIYMGEEVIQSSILVR